MQIQPRTVAPLSLSFTPSHSANEKGVARATPTGKFVIKNSPGTILTKRPPRGSELAHQKPCRCQRLVQSYPLRVNSRSRSPSRCKIGRKPSCLTSGIQSECEGTLVPRVGMQGENGLRGILNAIDDEISDCFEQGKVPPRSWPQLLFPSGASSVHGRSGRKCQAGGPLSLPRSGSSLALGPRAPR